jgi:hypothetical protein
MAGAWPGSELPASATDPPPDPPSGQREPLLRGPAADGPEGQGHAGAHRDQGDQHTDDRRARPQGQHPHHQARRHRGDLPAPPAGDDAPPLQR